MRESRQFRSKLCGANPWLAARLLRWQSGEERHRGPRAASGGNPLMVDVGVSAVDQRLDGMAAAGDEPGAVLMTITCAGGRLVFRGRGPPAVPKRMRRVFEDLEGWASAAGLCVTGSVSATAACEMKCRREILNNANIIVSLMPHNKTAAPSGAAVLLFRFETRYYQ